MDSVLKFFLIGGGVVCATCETIGTGVLIMNVTGNHALSSGPFFPLLFALGIFGGGFLAVLLLRRSGESTPPRVVAPALLVAVPLALAASGLFAMTFSFGPKAVCVGAYVVQMLFFLSAASLLFVKTRRMSQPEYTIELDPITADTAWFYGTLQAGTDSDRRS